MKTANDLSSHKRNILITGATGTMGQAALQELLGRLERFNLILLARPSKKNRKLLAPYEQMEGVTVIWGDLMDPEAVARGVASADIVLHIGGMVSPAADYYPEKTFMVNTTAMRNIVEAVKARKDADRVGVVYVGSVAQYGSYLPPHHWGRCGDPLQPAKLDGYAISKMAAERILTDSGLPKWVSLRQSGILSKAMLMNAADPIAFHVPLRGVLEWVTVEDSGRLMANVCEADIPGNFWCRFYNIGGGASYRLLNYEMEAKVMRSLGCPPPEKVFDVRWFATGNFHGMWFADSDRLEELTHFRGDVPADEYFAHMAKGLPWYYRLTPIVPAWVMKAVMRWVAGRNRLAPLYWKKHGVKERIDAHFGGMEAWDALPGWEGTDLSHPSDIPSPRPLAYDERKLPEELSLDDMKAVAASRGGKCLSQEMTEGDMLTLLDWETAEGIRFKGSPAAIALGGHWGPPVTAVDA